MSIDPRYLSTMLKLQLMSSVNFLSAGDSARAEGPVGESLFDGLLNRLLAGSPDLYGGSSLGLTQDEPAGSLPIGLLLGGSGIAAQLTALRVSAPTGTADYSEAEGHAASYDGLIERAAAKYGIDPRLVKAVVKTESSFDPYAVSSAGAKGLMQLMDATARELGVTDSFDPVQNIEGGTRFLAYLLHKYDGNAKAALAAYNAGPGRVDRTGIASDDDFDAMQGRLPGETQRYVGKVLEAYGRYAGAGIG